jgi:hypothetical protein
MLCPPVECPQPLRKKQRRPSRDGAPQQAERQFSRHANDAAAFRNLK